MPTAARERTSGRSRDLIWAAVFIIAAVGTPLLLWGAYRNVMIIHEGGRDGVLEVIAHRETVRGRRGRAMHHYDAVLDGVPVRLEQSRPMGEGEQYAVVYRADSLAAHAQSLPDPPPFRDFVFGTKAETGWDVFIRKTGTPLLWGAAGMELVWILGGMLSIRAYLRR